MEKQREPRTRTLKPAHIVFNDGGSVDRSHRAQLILLAARSPRRSGGFWRARSIHLLMDSDGSVRSARTIWKGHGQMGSAYGIYPR